MTLAAETYALWKTYIYIYMRMICFSLEDESLGRFQPTITLEPFLAMLIHPCLHQLNSSGSSVMRGRGKSSNPSRVGPDNRGLGRGPAPASHVEPLLEYLTCMHHRYQARMKSHQASPPRHKPKKNKTGQKKREREVYIYIHTISQKENERHGDRERERDKRIRPCTHLHACTVAYNFSYLYT